MVEMTFQSREPSVVVSMGSCGPSLRNNLAVRAHQIRTPSITIIKVSYNFYLDSEQKQRVIHITETSCKDILTSPSMVEIRQEPSERMFLAGSCAPCALIEVITPLRPALEKIQTLVNKMWTSGLNSLFGIPSERYIWSVPEARVSIYKDK